MTDSMHVFLAAEAENGRAVGYVGLMYVLDEGYISNVAVSQDRRRGDSRYAAWTSFVHEPRLRS